MSTGQWINDLSAEFMVCNTIGTILEMNSGAEALFAEEGGRNLLCTNVLDCHTGMARTKLERMLVKGSPNAYFISEKNGKRFFFQSPWFKDGQYAGFVEISFQVPELIPHFIRA
jgi:hypothetical protein